MFTSISSVEGHAGFLRTRFPRPFRAAHNQLLAKWKSSSHYKLIDRSWSTLAIKTFIDDYESLIMADASKNIILAQKLEGKTVTKRFPAGYDPDTPQKNPDLEVERVTLVKALYFNLDQVMEEGAYDNFRNRCLAKDPTLQKVGDVLTWTDARTLIIGLATSSSSALTLTEEVLNLKRKRNSKVFEWLSLLVARKSEATHLRATLPDDTWTELAWRQFMATEKRMVPRDTLAKMLVSADAHPESSLPRYRAPSVRKSPQRRNLAIPGLVSNRLHHPNHPNPSTHPSHAQHPGGPSP